MSVLVIFILIVLAALATGIFAVMRTRRFVSAGVIYLICFLVPIGFVTADCVASAISEACVWGKAFMPLYWGLSLIAGTLLYLGWLGLLWGIEKMRKPR